MFNKQQWSFLHNNIIFIYFTYNTTILIKFRQKTTLKIYTFRSTDNLAKRIYYIEIKAKIQTMCMVIFQNNVIGALGRMLSTGTLTDVTLSASGTSVKAHRLVLASCSQYFAQLFKVLYIFARKVIVYETFESRTLYRYERACLPNTK